MPRSRGGARQRARSGARSRPVQGAAGHRLMTATTLRSVRDEVRARSRSATEVCREALGRIAALDPQLHAFNTITADRALARAQAIDRDPDRWRDAPLAGVP